MLFRSTRGSRCMSTPRFPNHEPNTYTVPSRGARPLSWSMIQVLLATRSGVKLPRTVGALLSMISCGCIGIDREVIAIGFGPDRITVTAHPDNLETDCHCPDVTGTVPAWFRPIRYWGIGSSCADHLDAVQSPDQVCPRSRSAIHHGEHVSAPVQIGRAHV